MATEVEKLEKEIMALETKKRDHERKHGEAVQRRAELEGHQQSLRQKMADNDDPQGARREHRTLENRARELDEDAQAFATSVASADARLTSLRDELRRAERAEAVTELENQIAALGPVNNELEASLAVVKQITDKIISAAKNVAAELRRLDADRFGSSFEYKLTALIPEVVHHRLQEMSFPNAERSPSFIERAGVPLRSALAQLRYEALQGKIVPVKGESLYRTIGSMSGLRGLALRHGSLIALTEEEATPLVESGALELVEPVPATDQAA